MPESISSKPVAVAEDVINEIGQEINLSTEFIEMAMQQQAIEHSYSKWEAVNIYSKATGWCIASIFFVILFGYENFAGSTVISIGQFRQEFGHKTGSTYALDANWQSAISGGPAGTLVIGLLLGSWLADKFGRRRVVQVDLILMIPGLVLQITSKTIKQFFAGKFICGIFLGILLAVNNTYVGEISPLAIRGVVSSAMNFSSTFAHLIVLIVVYGTQNLSSSWAWKSIVASQFVILFACFIICPFMPESPYWLISNNEDEKAKESLRKLMPNEELVNAHFSVIKVTVMEAKKNNLSAKSRSWLDLFRGTNLRRTSIACFTFLMQGMSGVSFVGSYTPYYFELSGYPQSDAFKISIGGVTLACGGVIFSWFVIDRFGRRTLMLWGVGALVISDLLSASLGMQLSNAKAVRASAAFLCMFFFFYNCSLGALAYAFAVEAPTAELRVKTVGLSVAINNAIQCMWNFVLPYMFNQDQANMGSKIMFIFFGVTLISWFVFYFYLPEFKGRTYEELDELFAEKVPAKEFSTYVTRAELAEVSEKNNGLQYLVAAKNDVKTEATHIEEVNS